MLQWYLLGKNEDRRYEGETSAFVDLVVTISACMEIVIVCVGGGGGGTA